MINNSYITIIKEKRTDLSRKRIPLNQNECTADFRMSVPFEQNLQSERIHEFHSSGQTCKTWCQEHHVPVSTMNYWMRKLKTLDEQSDADMIFAKMPTETEISKNETLNISNLWSNHDRIA